MTGRRAGSWLVTVALMAGGLSVVSGDVGAQPSPPGGGAVVGAAAPVPLAGGLSGLPALPSLPPASGLATGGGGLGGATWGLFGDPTDDSAVMRAAGVQVDLAAPGWGAGAEYAVFEAGTTTQLWPASGASSGSVVPTGILRNGGAYEVAVTVGGVTTRRAFSVDASRAGTVSGVVTAGASSIPVAVNTGQKMAVGIGFSSADVGVTPDTGATGRLSEGLPAGWSWSGVGADVWRVEVVDGSASLPGVDRIVKAYGGSVLLLGCRDDAGSTVCDTAGGQLVGEGPRAVVQADGGVLLTEQSAGQALTFDPQGRLVRIAQPGAPPVAVTYTAAGGLDTVTWEVGSSPLVWQVFYPGDPECDDGALPPGFVTTPAGFVCGWTVPAGQRTRILYSRPTATSPPRISRVLQLPGCSPSMADCDPNLTVIADFGWDASNRLSALRDSLTARSMIAGLIAPTDRSHEQQMSYDAQGRLGSGRTPSPVVDGRGRLQAAAIPVVSSIAYGAAEATFAPATQQVAVTTNGAGSALTTTTAADDGGRITGSRAASGGVTRSVWPPFDDVLLGVIYPNGQAETTVFDRWFRRTGTHIGPTEAFGPGCTPTSPQRGDTDAAGTWTACAPLAGTTRATSSLVTFDEPEQVGTGLTASVFAPAATGLPSPFAGNPVGRAPADQASGADPGIPIAELAPEAAAGAGVRLDGGLLVPTDAGTEADSWTLRITAPASLVTTAVVVVDGRFCAVLDDGEGSCAVTPDTRAQHLIIDLELARPPTATDRVTIELQDPLGDPPVVDNSILVRRWSADTTLTKIDPLPAGTIAGWSDTTVTEHSYACGTATLEAACIGSAATAMQDPTGVNIRRSYTYATDEFGGVRQTSASQPEGQGATTFEHWGVDDTPAGLPNADQLGDLVTVPQRGLPKTTTLPGGRSTTTVHDEYGTPVCQAVNGGNWTCTALDVTRRPVTHTVRADTPGVAPVTITTDYAPAGNPLVNRTTRRTVGAGSRTTLTDTTSLAPSGRVMSYTDTLNTATAYVYDGMGRLSSTTITPPTVPGRAPRPRAPSAAAPGFTYATSFDATTGLQTGVTFQGRPLMSVGYENAEHPWLPTGYTYTLGAGATVTAEVNYDSDLNPFGRTWTLADASTLLDCSTAAVAPAGCTAEIGDSQPGTTASGRLLARSVDGNAHRFTYDTARRLTGATIGATDYAYTWDRNNNRTGVSVDGATTTFTFDAADRLTATTDPEATVGGFDADGNHTAVGADTYTYDALDQLASSTNTTSGTTTSYVRDGHGRITTQATSPGGRYYLGYSLPNGSRPSLTVDPTGAATPLLALPGGLLFRGDAQAPILTDMQGNTLLALTVDGRRPTSDGAPVPISQWDPFGRPTPDTPANPTTGPGGADFGWQLNQTDGSVTHMGVRALHTRLGTFLQPDPRPHGSQSGPYSYTNADPVNQADPTGLCTGWACVKVANQFLDPIADAATLLSCLLGFGVACFVTSLIKLAISVLNFAADFPLHQDAAADGVTLAMSFLNLVAATPLLYEAIRVGQVSDSLGLSAARARWFQEAVTGDDTLAATEKIQGSSEASVRTADAYGDEGPLLRFRRINSALDDLSLWNTRATYVARAGTVISTVGEYGARITSDNLYGCCWKLW